MYTVSAVEVSAFDETWSVAALLEPQDLGEQSLIHALPGDPLPWPVQLPIRNATGPRYLPPWWLAPSAPPAARNIGTCAPAYHAGGAASAVSCTQAQNSTSVITIIKPSHTYKCAKSNQAVLYCPR